VTYGLIVLASTAVFYTPWAILKNMNEDKRDEMISLGIFSPKSHPLYRPSLYSFLREPNAKGKTTAIGDTYKAYGVTVKIDLQEEDNDSLGFPNTIPASDAAVLFVGDSFGVGVSVGSKLCPAAVYAKMTNAKVYNASNGSWGPVQYVDIIKMMTQELPKEKRFSGKDVVVLFYLGNDFDVDMLQYEMRKMQTDHVVSWLFALKPLREWVNFLQLANWKDQHVQSHGQDQQTQTTDEIPHGIYAPIPMKCETVRGLPFAWHLSYLGWIHQGYDPKRWNAIDKVIGELKSFEAKGLRIKVVLVPTSVQILSDNIDWASVPKDSRIEADTKKLKEIQDQTKEKATAIFKKYGFDVLDLADVMNASPQKCLYYQPVDTHCTALGYEAIGKAIAAKWPDLGK